MISPKKVGEQNRAELALIALQQVMMMFPSIKNGVIKHSSTKMFESTPDTFNAEISSVINANMVLVKISLSGTDLCKFNLVISNMADISNNTANEIKNYFERKGFVKYKPLKTRRHR